MPVEGVEPGHTGVARCGDDPVDHLRGTQLRVLRPDEGGYPGDQGRRARGSGPLGIPSAGKPSHQVLGRRRDGDADPLGGRLTACHPRAVESCNGEDAGDGRGRTDLGQSACAVARGSDDHHVLLLGVQERLVPTLRPGGGGASQRHVDDVGAVVDGPPHRRRDLVVDVDPGGVGPARRSVDPYGHRKQFGFRRHPHNSVRAPPIDAQGTRGLRGRGKSLPRERLG